MPICSFCKRNYDEHKGLIVFTFEGKALRFCSSKCRKNKELGRNPKKVRWVKKIKKKKEKN